MTEKNLFRLLFALLLVEDEDDEEYGEILTSLILISPLKYDFCDKSDDAMSSKIRYNISSHLVSIP